MRNERITYLDALRGFAILLVVIGHLIQSNYQDALSNPIFNIIYSFHMPLFFFLSGCSRAISERNITEAKDVKSVTKDVITKFCSLIIPSVAWTLLVPQFFCNEITQSSSISGYWFLNVLFAISVLWSILSLLMTWLRKGWTVVLMTLIGIIICFIFDIYRIPLVYLLLFLLGYVWQQRSLSEKIPSAVISVVSVIFLLAVGKYEYGLSPSGNPDRVWLLLPLSCAASIVLHYVFSKNLLNSKCLILLGRYSLGIYLCHFFFIHMPMIEWVQHQFSNVLQFFILSLIAVSISGICVLIQKVVSQIAWLNGLLYGNWKFLMKNEGGR